VREEYANKETSKLAEMAKEPINTGAMAGCAGRQSSKALLLEHADRLRREANQLEALAYAVERVQGDAEGTLYRLLASDFFRR
jgi:hypothetical protein